MNILITCDRLDCLGGLEEHVISKVEYLLKQGHKVHLDCNALSGTYYDRIPHDNLTVSVPWSDPWNNVCSDIEEFVPDVVHAHPFSAIHRGAIVSHHFNVPIIFTIHGEYAYKIPDQLCKKAYKIIVVASKLIDKYKNYDYEVIPNGIDTNLFYNTNNVKTNIHHRTISIISRLHDGKEKPIIDFIKACKYLPETTSVEIIGDGHCADDIKKVVEEVAVHEECKCQFVLIGASSQINVHINNSDLVCGCDRVALEALCCGKPVFYLGQGHMKDLLSYDNYKEYLFTNKGKKVYTEKELANRIVNILEPIIFPEQRLVEEVRRDYSLETQMKVIEEIYRNSVK